MFLVLVTLQVITISCTNCIVLGPTILDKYTMLLFLCDHILFSANTSSTKHRTIRNCGGSKMLPNTMFSIFCESKRSGQMVIIMFNSSTYYKVFLSGALTNPTLTIQNTYCTDC